MTEPSYLSSTQAAYDAVAVRYAERYKAQLDGKPLDSALLTNFAELVQGTGTGPVADLGCGPGHLTAHMHALGVNTFGVDLSPTMVGLASEAYPDLRFEVGSMTSLDIEDGALGGIIAWYSIIHTPPEHLPQVFAEFNRILAPDGHLLLAFQGDDDSANSARAFDHKVALAYRWSPQSIADLLRKVGLVGTTELVREPAEGERFRQAFVIACKPGKLQHSHGHSEVEAF
jgi:SAM-dependent methyltransferase